MPFSTYYSVQSADDAARLASGGEPWPTSPNKAHIGAGLYSWGTRDDAQLYWERLRNRGIDVDILSFRISNSNLKKLRRLDLRPPISDTIVNGWLEIHSSLYGEGRPHSYQYVIRMTNSGAEHYFSKDVFPLFTLILNAER
ncbi:hypothetical protein BCD67_04945 [Oscillatoriales cyanobacterium USR001]|nr:hypothetical protein BCD67_04945 [Oscillatoriales cyanobacterium USR001]